MALGRDGAQPCGKGSQTLLETPGQWQGVLSQPVGAGHREPHAHTPRLPHTCIHMCTHTHMCTHVHSHVCKCMPKNTQGGLCARPRGTMAERKLAARPPPPGTPSHWPACAWTGGDQRVGGGRDAAVSTASGWPRATYAGCLLTRGSPRTQARSQMRWVPAGTPLASSPDAPAVNMPPVTRTFPHSQGEERPCPSARVLSGGPGGHHSRPHVGGGEQRKQGSGQPGRAWAPRAAPCTWNPRSPLPAAQPGRRFPRSREGRRQHLGLHGLQAQATWRQDRTGSERTEPSAGRWASRSHPGGRCQEPGPQSRAAPPTQTAVPASTTPPSPPSPVPLCRRPALSSAGLQSKPCFGFKRGKTEGLANDRHLSGH